VFVDDFIGMTNGNTEAHLRHVSRAMLHGVHSIFPQPDASGHDGEDPIAQSKLDNGDGEWNYVKEVLGWIIDGENYTITALIKTIVKNPRCHLKKFQVLAGKLQHASYGIPGGAGLFSPIEMAATHAKEATLLDWRALVNLFKTTPTPVHVALGQEELQHQGSTASGTQFDSMNGQRTSRK